MHSFPILMIFILPERNNKSMVNQIVDPTILTLETWKI